MIKLNLGGGPNWTMEGWQNLDLSRGYDLIVKRLDPYDDDSVDLIYSSHNIEHMPWDFVPFYFEMVYRVLKPQSVFRLAFPDSDILWSVLKNNDNSKILSNTNYYVGEKATRPIIENVRQIFGFDPNQNSKRFLKGTMHSSFYTPSIVGLFAKITGFSQVIPQKINESVVDDFKNEAMYSGKTYISGFDNKYHKDITSYIEMIK